MARPQQRVSQVASFPAPTGGIDDYSPLAAMEPQFCIDLINFYPATNALTLRSGYQEWAIGLTGKVYTMINYAAVDGTRKLFACTNDGVYDVSAKGAAPVKVADITYGVVSHCHFGNVAGNYLVLCNGVDEPLLFNGTTWESFTFANTPETNGEIEGVDPSVWSHVIAYKGRLWFVQKDSMVAWYLDTDAIAGIAKPFYFASVFQRGGHITSMMTWSLDSGAGMDDKLVVQSSQGELAIYSGNDPATIDTWQLESVFFTSAPIGVKSSCELGGDILMLVRNGVMSLNSIVKGEADIALTDSTLSKRISRTINRIVNTVDYVPDWEIFNFPSLQAIVVLIPESSNYRAMQLVMNALTGAWTKFDMPMRSATIHNGKLFFGTDDGRVMQYGGVRRDGDKLDGSQGVDIYCALFSAYNYMNDRTTNKHFKLARPIFEGTRPPGYRLKLSVDYDMARLAENPTPPSADAEDPVWDKSLWDNAFWTSTGMVYRPWTGVTGLGFCAALQLKLTAEEATNFAAIEIVFEPGAAI